MDPQRVLQNVQYYGSTSSSKDMITGEYIVKVNHYSQHYILQSVTRAKRLDIDEGLCKNLTFEFRLSFFWVEKLQHDSSNGSQDKRDLEGEMVSYAWKGIKEQQLGKYRPARRVQGYPLNNLACTT